MKYFDIFWKLSLLVLGFIAVVTMSSSFENKDDYNARYDAFLVCKNNNPGEVCAQLFSGK
jgi:endo-beta-N-acetylglucosaminidase D